LLWRSWKVQTLILLELHRAVVNIAEEMKAADNTWQKMRIKRPMRPGR
jgi:hypothetical protein